MSESNTTMQWHLSDFWSMAKISKTIDYTYWFQLFSVLLFRISNGGQKTAGDVLNDIGSMLADLTDELDAMLHMDPNNPNNKAN